MPSVVYDAFSSLIYNRKKNGYFRSISSQFSDYKLDFTLNDYLSLDHSCYSSFDSHGNLFGSNAARLVKNHLVLQKLENRIAGLKNAGSALIFPSGYQLNSSVIKSILSSGSRSDFLVFSDELNHESIWNGIISSGVRFVQYENCNMLDLEKNLQKYKDDNRIKFVFTEYLFGMDGTIVDLEYLYFLKQKYNLFVYIDEAHAIGVLGDGGCSVVNCDKYNFDVIMGNFSKAFSCQGGYLACNQIVYDYVVNFCGGFLFSTSLSPLLAQFVLNVFNDLQNLQDKRIYLFNLASYLQKRLLENGFNIGNVNKISYIIPIIFSDNDILLQTQQKLHDAGIKIAAIRYPTVPKDKPRIRISLNAKHTYEDINFLISSLTS
jgi:8-amino-7-oxononanoate synthase